MSLCAALFCDYGRCPAVGQVEREIAQNGVTDVVLGNATWRLREATAAACRATGASLHGGRPEWHDWGRYAGRIADTDALGYADLVIVFEHDIVFEADARGLPVLYRRIERPPYRDI